MFKWYLLVAVVWLFAIFCPIPTIHIDHRVWLMACSALCLWAKHSVELEKRQDAAGNRTGDVQ